MKVKTDIHICIFRQKRQVGISRQILCILQDFYIIMIDLMRLLVFFISFIFFDDIDPDGEIIFFLFRISVETRKPYRLFKRRLLQFFGFGKCGNHNLSGLANGNDRKLFDGLNVYRPITCGAFIKRQFKAETQYVADRRNPFGHLYGLINLKRMQCVQVEIKQIAVQISFFLHVRHDCIQQRCYIRILCKVPDQFDTLLIDAVHWYFV